jgi:hypothetical protein
MRILTLSMHQTSILWRINNTAALAHIQKEGGLKGRALLEGAERILLLAHQRHLRLLPAFIPSSRGKYPGNTSIYQVYRRFCCTCK